MRHINSKGFILLLLLYSFILLKEGIMMAKVNNILHLEKKEFDIFFEKNPDWKENFFEKCKCSRLKYKFFCWDKETKKILFPDVGVVTRLCSDRKLPEVLNDKLAAHYKNIKPRKTYLITNDHMVQISLQHLAKNEYPCIYDMKSSSKDKEENIEFYIFDFNQKNTMEIYYCLRDSAGKLKLIANTICLNEPTYVRKWENISKDIFCGKRPGIRINIKLSVLIGERAIVDIYPDTKFIHFKNSEKDPTERHNKLVTTYAGNSYLINDLVFNLSDEKDLTMLITDGIYVGPIKNEKRITYSSLYSLIKEYFDKTNLVIKDNTFELFYARTTNFKKDTSELNEKPNERIKNVELPNILSFIEEILRRRKRTTTIQLVGYADQEGKIKTNWKEWNSALSIKRATNVKVWLKNKLEALGFINKEDFDFDEPKGCSEKYYDFNDRCVDIKVF